MGNEIQPVVDLIVRFDARTGKTGMTVIGDDASIDTLYKMLDAARDELRRIELAALKQQLEKKNETVTRLPDMPDPADVGMPPSAS